MRISAIDHRARVFGMGKEEIIRKVKDFSFENLNINPSEKFLRKFTTPQLYGLMRAVYGGHWHPILSEWSNEKKDDTQTSPPTVVPITGATETKQLRMF